MSAATEEIFDTDHEQVVLVADRATALRAIVAVHSTALGPSLGGIRFWHYDDVDDALRDVLRLSEAMSLKASAAGLHQGGGKAVVLWDDPGRPRSDAFLRVLGRAIDELGGRYIAAEDVGATTRDMDTIALETPWVTGTSGPGGSGDPSPITAVGVLHAIRAVLRELDGDAQLRRRHVVVQGCGKVGSNLAELLVRDGASVTVADTRHEAVDALVNEHGVQATAVEDVLRQSCDVLAPCALGGVLGHETVGQLRCRAVCGGANNQLAEASVGDALADRGILYAPDFVANAGGIINIAEEFTGYDRDRALQQVVGIEQTMSRVFGLARELGVTPNRAAETMARQRISQEGSGRRWHPGDPAAWTNGEPLRTLRPVPVPRTA
jgi:glutamate dehydrogenase/leucine dehydrogenase